VILTRTNWYAHSGGRSRSFLCAYSRQVIMLLSEALMWTVIGASSVSDDLRATDRDCCLAARRSIVA